MLCNLFKHPKQKWESCVVNVMDLQEKLNSRFIELFEP